MITTLMVLGFVFLILLAVAMFALALSPCDSGLGPNVLCLLLGLAVWTGIVLVVEQMVQGHITFVPENRIGCP